MSMALSSSMIPPRTNGSSNPSSRKTVFRSRRSHLGGLQHENQMVAAWSSHRETPEQKGSVCRPGVGRVGQPVHDTPINWQLLLDLGGVDEGLERVIALTAAPAYCTSELGCTKRSVPTLLMYSHYRIHNSDKQICMCLSRLAVSSMALIT